MAFGGVRHNGFPQDSAGDPRALLYRGIHVDGLGDVGQG